MERKTSGLPFRYAWINMLNRRKVRRENWEGYWAFENGTIMIHKKDGTVLNILDTDDPVFTFNNIASDDWEVVRED